MTYPTTMVSRFSRTKDVNLAVVLLELRRVTVKWLCMLIRCSVFRNGGTDYATGEALLTSWAFCAVP